MIWNYFKTFYEENVKTKKIMIKWDKLQINRQKLFAAVKTHTFNKIEKINVEELKFRSIIDQACVFTYNCNRIIAEYLKLLCQNEYNIKDTLFFSRNAGRFIFIKQWWKKISHDLDSFFTNITLKETIVWKKKN